METILGYHLAETLVYSENWHPNDRGRHSEKNRKKDCRVAHGQVRGEDRTKARHEQSRADQDEESNEEIDEKDDYEEVHKKDIAR